jgi:hypothetical protein
MNEKISDEIGQALMDRLSAALEPSGRPLMPADLLLAAPLIRALLRSVTTDRLTSFEVKGQKFFGVAPGVLLRGWVGLTFGENNRFEWRAEVEGDEGHESWVAYYAVGGIEIDLGENNWDVVGLKNAESSFAEALEVLLT